MYDSPISTGVQFAEKPLDAEDRRKRSEMTDEEAYQTLGEFAQSILRMCNSSESYHAVDDKPCSPRGVLVYKFEVAGDFVNTPDVFEALRVAGRYKLPRPHKKEASSEPQ